MLNLIKHQKEDVNRHLLMSHCRKTINGWSPWWYFGRSFLTTWSKIFQTKLLEKPFNPINSHFLSRCPSHLSYRSATAISSSVEVRKKSFPLCCSFSLVKLCPQAFPPKSKWLQLREAPFRKVVLLNWHCQSSLWDPPFMTGDCPNMAHFGPKLAKHGRLVNIPTWKSSTKRSRC